MQSNLRMILAIFALVAGYAAYASPPGGHYPPPQPPRGDGYTCHDYGNCDSDMVPEREEAPPMDDDYYGPGQNGDAGYYADDCLPPYDPSLFYYCDSPYDSFYNSCGVRQGPYGYSFPYPRFGINPGFARQWWGNYGRRGLVGIYNRNDYRGYRPQFRQGYVPQQGYGQPGYPQPRYGFAQPRMMPRQLPVRRFR